MIKFFRVFVVSVFALMMSAVMGSTAMSAERVWESGTVWSVSFAKTKPGKYNDYLADLNNVWRKYIEAQMKDGDIVSYKILNMAAARADESNLILMVEFKNWATFDRGAEYFEKMAEKIQGSLDKSTQANIDRGALRTLNGQILLQEVKFK